MGIERALAAVLAAAFLWMTATAHAAEDDMAPLHALAQREAARGSDGARSMLGLLDGRTDKDQTVRAMGWLVKAAGQGYAGAQAQLGSMFFRGEGGRPHRPPQRPLLAETRRRAGPAAGARDPRRSGEARGPGSERSAAGRPGKVT